MQSKGRPSEFRASVFDLKEKPKEHVLKHIKKGKSEFCARVCVRERVRDIERERERAIFVVYKRRESDRRVGYKSKKKNEGVK